MAGVLRAAPGAEGAVPAQGVELPLAEQPAVVVLPGAARLSAVVEVEPVPSAVAAVAVPDALPDAALERTPAVLHVVVPLEVQLSAAQAVQHAAVAQAPTSAALPALARAQAQVWAPLAPREESLPAQPAAVVPLPVCCEGHDPGLGRPATSRHHVQRHSDQHGCSETDRLRRSCCAYRGSVCCRESNLRRSSRDNKDHGRASPNPDSTTVR